MNSDEILEVIKNLDPEERWKLLEKMYHEYYNTRVARGEEIA